MISLAKSRCKRNTRAAIASVVVVSRSPNPEPSLELGLVLAFLPLFRVARAVALLVFKIDWVPGAQGVLVAPCFLRATGQGNNLFP